MYHRDHRLVTVRQIGKNAGIKLLVLAITSKRIYVIPRTETLAAYLDDDDVNFTVLLDIQKLPFHLVRQHAVKRI